MAGLLAPLILTTAAQADSPETWALPAEEPAPLEAPEPWETDPLLRDAETPESPEETAFPEAEDWQLLLVNAQNPLPEDFSVKLRTLPNGTRVDERAYDALSEMLRDCRAAGLRPLICSAYRTRAVQSRLYQNKIARLRAAGYGPEEAVLEAGRWVAAPDTSEHQTGLALDIVAASYQLLNRRQEETPEQKWLMEHCWEYGFILRYPAEKSEETGIGYEPWHYRYVGAPTAAVLRDSGLCLEEYLALRSAHEAEGSAGSGAESAPLETVSMQALP